MKLVMTIILLLAVAAMVTAQQNNAPGANTNTATSILKSSIKKPGVLTDEDIAAFKTSFTDEKTNKKYAFICSFSQRQPATEFEKKKYERNGKVPFRITCELMQIKEVKGKEVGFLESGTASIMLQDSEGKVLLTETRSLDKMCPS